MPAVERVMNISAHPLVVAVALGLLGPSVLREDVEERCESCTCGLQPEGTLECLRDEEDEA
jgi:hypothetical protein